MVGKVAPQLFRYHHFGIICALRENVEEPVILTN